MLYRWKREQVPSRLPPERLDRAITSGFRYVVHTPTIRVVLWRTAATGIAGGAMSAFMPLVAKDLLGGSAQTYGLLLGSFGMGAIISALNILYIRQRLAGEAIIRLCAIVMAAAIAVEAMSGSVAPSAVVLFAAGGAWMVSVAISNITIQLSAPAGWRGKRLRRFRRPSAEASHLVAGCGAWSRKAMALRRLFLPRRELWPSRRYWPSG